VKIRLAERTRFDPSTLVKVALASTPRVQLDLYCLTPGQSQKRHVHADQDKFYLVLEGSGRFAVGATEERLETGEAVLAPAGQEHGVVNDGTAPLVVLVVMSPPPRH
jgi:quercetin dioxygenase-like cupin family protein